jgi:phosphate-selective porin OprO/OprP
MTVKSARGTVSTQSRRDSRVCPCTPTTARTTCTWDWPLGRSPTDDSITFSSKPEANLAPAYVSAKLAAETVDLVGAEAAWILGPLSLQGEYTMASVEGVSGADPDPDFDGYYLQASYFLTGEFRPYNKTAGCIGPIKPESNAFAKDGGHGAWEVAARYSSIDLADSGVDKGQLQDVTLGVNWYLNPNTRVMFNYIRADLTPTSPADDGTTDIYLMRFQFAF